MLHLKTSVVPYNWHHISSYSAYFVLLTSIPIQRDPVSLTISSNHRTPGLHSGDRSVIAMVQHPSSRLYTLTS